MPDKKGERVPKYKLTKEQVDFQKNFETVQKVQRALQMKSLALRAAGEQLQMQYAALDRIAQQIQPPEKPMHELEGMDFKAEDFMMRY